MVLANTSECTICGEMVAREPQQFLVVEDHCFDRLKILRWDDRLAAMPGVHSVCSPSHLQQLVVHWMTTGSLNHPFARARFGLRRHPQPSRLRASAPARINRRSGTQVGEIAVHRESMQRVLGENPQSLQPILRALLSGLEREPEDDWNPFEEELRQA